MNIVRLNPKHFGVNSSIEASSGMTRKALAGVLVDRGEVGSALLGGTIHNGHNEVTAQIAPGTSGTTKLSFEIVVPSISSSSFYSYRTILKKILTSAEEKNIARTAGIKTPPPPEPSSRMANYALSLFSSVVFNNEVVSDQSRTFSIQDCTHSECVNILKVTRLLEVTKVQLSGSLAVNSKLPAAERVAAYVPITAIEFDDGLTIPFAGYSDNVLVDHYGLKHFKIPGKFWTGKNERQKKK